MLFRSGKTVEINHIFHPVFLSGHFKSRFETKYLSPVINDRQIEVHILRKGHTISDQILHNLYRLKELQRNPNAEFPTRNILSDTWLILVNELRENPGERVLAGTEQKDRLRSMIAYIHRHYAEKITLSEIAEVSGISEREALGV